MSLSNRRWSKRRVNGVYVSKRRPGVTRSALAFVLFCVTVPALRAQAAPDGTPERALQDLALASRPEDVERHLPVATVEAAKTLAPDDRRAFEAILVWRRGDLQNQPQIEVPDDGHAFLVSRIGDNQPSEAHLTESVVTGLDAVLRFSVEGAVPVPLDVIAWMRYEDGEWRLREIDGGRYQPSIRFDDPQFVERFRHREQKQSESAAIGTLYRVCFAIGRYTREHPEAGIPDDLAALAAVQDGNSEDPDTTTDDYLTPDLARNDFESTGYRFHYDLLRGGVEGTYLITARPVKDANGRFSYVINEQGDVHQTEEDRDATIEDPFASQ